MFGRDEYRYFTNRIEHERDTLRSVRESLLEHRGELFQDDATDATQATRDYLRNASVRIADTLAQLDEALAALPVPVVPRHPELLR